VPIDLPKDWRKPKNKKTLFATDMKYLLILFIAFSTRLAAQNYMMPKLEFVCELKVTVDKMLMVGATSHGERRIIPITGGTFEGPNMKGIVLPGGADYQLDANGRTAIEAIYTIKSDDGALIHIRNAGIIRLNAGKFYFTTNIKFEAPLGSKYEWLNNSIFLSKGVPGGQYISIQVWKVSGCVTTGNRLLNPLILFHPQK
jgi:hypothetical protein